MVQVAGSIFYGSYVYIIETHQAQYKRVSIYILDSTPAWKYKLFLLILLKQNNVLGFYLTQCQYTLLDSREYHTTLVVWKLLVSSSTRAYQNEQDFTNKKNGEEE